MGATAGGGAFWWQHKPSMCILTGLESRDLRRAQRAAIAMSGTHGDPHINMAPTGTGDRRRALRSEAY